MREDESTSAFRLVGNGRGNFVAFLSLIGFEKFDFAVSPRCSVSLRKRKTMKAEMKAVTAVYMHANLKPSNKPWF